MTQLTLMKRSTPSKDRYGTPKEVFTNYLLDTSVNLFIQPVQAKEIMLEEGYQVADYRKIYYSPNLNPLPAFQDRVLYQGITYMVLPPQEYEVGGGLVYIKALLRRLVST